MKRILTAIAGMALSLTALAQTLRVDAPNLVELTERFNVAFVIEGESPSDFSWEPGSDFSLVWGPQRGSSTSVQMVNGKVSKSSQTTYTYILQPTKSGTFTLPAASATVKGNTLYSKSFTIQVVGGGGASQGNNASQAQSSSSQSSEKASSSAAAGTDDLFMRLTLSRRDVVVGEPVTATLKIYHRTNLVGFENAKFPTFNGFWSQETLTPSNIEFQKEQSGDKIYNAAVLRQWVLIPQKTGTLTIDPAEIVCLVNVRSKRIRSGSIFDDFFDNDYVTQRLRIATGAATVQVSALPAGAPPTFGGGVGNYTVSASLTKDSLKAHDAASLIVTVSGKGNVSLLEAPKVDFPLDFEVYDIKTTTNTDKSGTSGSKTFEYPFIPRSAGKFVIPGVRYTYYDAKAKRYATATADSLRITVERSSVTEAAAVQSGSTLTVDRKTVKNLSEDIRFIKSRTSLSSEKRFFIGTGLWWGLAALLCALALGLWLGLRKMAALKADVAGSKNRKATKMALRRLRQADEFRSKGLQTAFYEELHKALLGFVSDKLTMDMADQTKENIAAALSRGGVPETVVDDFTTLMDDCEYARYAPSSEQGNMDRQYEKAVSVITGIDATMKTKKNTGALAVALLLMLAPFAAQAAEDYPDSLWRSGVEAYTAGDWATAASAWEDVLSTGLSSKELYFNLGNAYFKQNEVGKAILNYERAARLDPADKDVRYNLDYARSTAQDRIDSVPEFFLKTWARNFCHTMGADTWGVLALVLLALTLALVLLFLLGASPAARKTGFFAGIAALLLTLMCAGFGFWQKNDLQKRDAAVVMRTVAAVKSSPSADTAKDLFILHEGTRVQLLDEVSGWVNISLADGRQGWMNAKDIEVI